MTAPSRARFGVVWFAVTLAVITYVDRVCISQSAKQIQHDLGLTDLQMGYVFSIFIWTYGLFEVPWGWLGDRMGARKVILRIVVCWSIFTAATGWTVGLVSLLITRALFGVGEAGCFPNVTKMFTTWLPGGERVRAQGLLWLSARWAGAFTPVLVALLMTHVMSWRHTFMLFGAVGLVWCLFFNRWYRDDPRDHPSVNSAELELLPRPQAAGRGHGRVPWKRVLSSPSAWLLFIQYFLLAYGAMFYMTWLPKYLIDVRKMSLHQGALLAGLPLFFAGLGSLFCGFFLARLGKMLGSVAKARRLMAITGFLASSGLFLVFIKVDNPVWAMVFLGLAGFANDLVMPSSWAACMDKGGSFAGTLSGTMNMLGCAGGGLFPVAAQYILNWTGQNWNIVFYVSAAAYFLGAFCWIVLDPVTSLDSEAKETHA